MRVTLGAVAISLALTSALAAEDRLTLALGDGSLIHYTLDRPAGEAAGLLVIAQGSGCIPGAANPAMGQVRAAFADYTALIVEKIGITPDADIVDGDLDCPQEFIERYALSQRVDDYLLVLESLVQDDSFGDRLVLFGGSEGGLAVARLAGEIAPDATIILSSATGPNFGDMVKATVPPEAHPHFDAVFAEARANPESDTPFGGSTYRFWADIIDMSTAELMLRSDSPFLLIQGGRDVSNPLALAWATVDAYAQSGKCGLTYWEFPALDHGMRREDGASRLAEVMALAAQWAEKPSPSC